MIINYVSNASLKKIIQVKKKKKKDDRIKSLKSLQTEFNKVRVSIEKSTTFKVKRICETPLEEIITFKN